MKLEQTDSGLWVAEYKKSEWASIRIIADTVPEAMRLMAETISKWHEFSLGEQE